MTGLPIRALTRHAQDEIQDRLAVIRAAMAVGAMPSRRVSPIQVTITDSSVGGPGSAEVRVSVGDFMSSDVYRVGTIQEAVRCEARRAIRGQYRLAREALAGMPDPE